MMFITAVKQIRIAITLLFLMTLLTGIIYPVSIKFFADLIFPWQANGSLLTKNSDIIGSALIGQNFTDPGYFWPRPSATTLGPYNPLHSAGSNLALSNPLYWQKVETQINKLKTVDPSNHLLIPVDLVTASASGLDPEISPYAAFYQAHRVAVARGISEESVQALIDSHIQPRTWGMLGEPRVNVLQLNLALDNMVNKEGNQHANSTPQS